MIRRKLILHFELGIGIGIEFGLGWGWIGKERRKGHDARRLHWFSFSFLFVVFSFLIR
jgi:hypothetical protein